LPLAPRPLPLPFQCDHPRRTGAARSDRQNPAHAEFQHLFFVEHADAEADFLRELACNLRQGRGVDVVAGTRGDRAGEVLAVGDGLGALNGSAGGLGIGLTLVKRLIEMHGGKITAQSEGRGKGSEFIMSVPTTSACVSQPEIPTEEATTETSKPIRILVVDDNQDSADSLGLLLQLLGNEVRIAHDGLAGVNLANEFQPRVVLLDIGLPTLNGFEAAERIRQQPWGKEAVMIAVTGWGETVDRQRSKKAGFDYHLVKPVDPDVLTRLLQTL